jgi:predicted choloylglycine hydrolase
MQKLFLALSSFIFFVSPLLAAPVVKDEVLLTQGKDVYQSVRHIVIRGSNEEIGRALGDIARKDYGINKLVKYPDKAYARAMDEYLRKDYPILRARSMGVAKSYGQDYGESLSVFSQLVYDAGPWNGCSSVYYPPSFTTTGGGLLGHNMDYPLCSINKLLKIPADNSPSMFTRNFVIELYPDQGYASIGVGTGDLLSVVTGMNEAGLIAILHTDNYTLINTDPDPDLSGLVFPTQLLRCVLENCQTVEEAKKVILNNKISLTFEPAHLLIADPTGKSVCVEINPKNMRMEFTENNGKPQPFTNHPLYRFKAPVDFPKYTPFELDSTFARFDQLTEMLSRKKRFSPEDAIDNQVRVAARWNNPGRGSANPSIPNRTIWTDLYDQKARTLKVMFYLKDGPVDPSTGDPQSLVYCDAFTFKLKR